ncbi:MAG: polysaccharide deacetylase family protein, partial [Erysipelotrichaceae bacterium]|nr:polysaccharide deacetylase family protein [Erysipelotrichaceae bacterium]
MGKTFNILQFPGHKSKAFTLSYDDGVLQDKRLIELFDRYGVKCTFNLGYGVLGFKGEAGPEGQRIDISKIETKEVKELYKNHEVGGHGLYHSDLAHIGRPNAMYEIVEDKAKLESLVGYPLSMFAYPFGLYNEDVKQLLKEAGYKGARTVKSTHSF